MNRYPGRALTGVATAAALAVITSVVLPLSYAEPVPALAHTATTGGPIVLKEARLSLDGKSTLHDYSASTSAVDVRVVAANPPAAITWTEVLKPAAVTAFDVRIAVKSLKSDKEALDKNMYKALKAEQSPDITFSARGYETAAPTKDGVPLKVRGVLTVAGVDRDVELTLIAHEADGRLTVAGEKELLMTDFGIQPPKFMLGALKTDNRIVIRFSLVFAVASL